MQDSDNDNDNDNRREHIENSRNSDNEKKGNEHTDDEDDTDEDSGTNKTTLEELKKKTKIKSIHGVHPKNLIEKITRIKIQSHPYWKEKCIGLNEESLVDRAMALESYGGTYGGNKQPTQFLCLLLKMLQIQPEMEIIKEFIENEDFKYVRILGAFYLRLIGKSVEIYKLLDPLFNDFRTLKRKTDLGNAKVFVDQFIQELLTTNYSCDIALPHIQSRTTLIQQGLLKERESPLIELGLVDLKKIELEEYQKILNERKPKSSSSTKPMEIENNKHKERPTGSRDDDLHKSSYRDHRDKSRDGGDSGNRNRYRDRDYDNRSRRDYENTYSSSGDRNRDGERDNYSRLSSNGGDGYIDSNRDRYRDFDRRERRDYGEIDSTSSSSSRRDYERNRDRDRDYKKRSRSSNSDNQEEEEEGSILSSITKNNKKKDISKYEKSSSTTQSNSNNNNNTNNGNEKSEIEQMNELRAKLGLKPLK